MAGGGEKKKEGKNGTARKENLFILSSWQTQQGENKQPNMRGDLWRVQSFKIFTEKKVTLILQGETGIALHLNWKSGTQRASSFA